VQLYEYHAGELGSVAAGTGLARQGRGVTAAFGKQDDLNHLDVCMKLIFHVERW